MGVNVKPSNMGRYLTYKGDNGTYGELYVREVDVPAFTTPKTILLKKSQGLNFSWAPDDSRVAYVYNDSQNRFAARLAISDWNGANRIEIPLEGSRRGDYIEINGFSPDGSVLALAYRNLELERKIEFYDSATLRKISEMPYMQRSSLVAIPLELVIWSPTETRFATVAFDDLSAWVTVGTPEEPEQYKVRFADNIYQGSVVWSPDGTYLMIWYPAYNAALDATVTAFILLRMDDGTYEYIGFGTEPREGIESLAPSDSAWLGDMWVFKAYGDTKAEVNLMGYSPTSVQKWTIAENIAFAPRSAIGEHLYFATYGVDRKETLHRLNTDGTVTVLDFKDSWFIEARADPNGQYFIATYASKDQPSTMFVDNGRTEPIRIEGENVKIVQVSPDRKLWTVWLRSAEQDKYRSAIHLLNIDSGTVSLLSDQVVEIEPMDAVAAGFSPDTQYFLLLTYDALNSFEYTLASTDPADEFTDTIPLQAEFVWSPDSTHIAFFDAYNNTGAQFHVYDVRTRQLTSFNVGTADISAFPRWVWCR
jgi:hypothetical protein